MEYKGSKVTPYQIRHDTTRHSTNRQKRSLKKGDSTLTDPMQCKTLWTMWYGDIKDIPSPNQLHFLTRLIYDLENENNKP